MKLQVYRISDLEQLVRSEYFRAQDHLPVSPERVQSYLQNPRSQPDMPVLFSLSDNDLIIAYRSLLPDYFISQGEKVPFAWLSGNFVASHYRRKGLSSDLFREVESAWEGRLMYTNYAPASKAVYDQTGAFVHVRSRDGRRYYLRSMLYPQLKNRTVMAPALRLTDTVINLLHTPGENGDRYQVADGISVEEIPLRPNMIQSNTVPGKQANALGELSFPAWFNSEGLEGYASDSLFSRGPEEFEWIAKYPWITSRPGEEFKGEYAFTRIVDRHISSWFRISSQQDEAFLWINIVNNRLSVPYFFNNDPMLNVAARQLVLKTAVSMQCDLITIRHPDLGPALSSRKNPFVYFKKMPQYYFAHKNLADKFPAYGEIYDGDGDCVFT